MDWASWGGEEEEWKAGTEQRWGGKENWGRTEEVSDGPADEARALGRCEASQDLERREIGTGWKRAAWAKAPAQGEIQGAENEMG